MTPTPQSDKDLDIIRDYLVMCSNWEIEQKMALDALHRIRSRPSPSTPEPKFNSTDLLLLAHDEWKRREERKHNHPEQAWGAGFINGFLTDKKWAREMVDKIRSKGGNP